MEDGEGGQVEGIVALTGEIDVDFVEDAVAEIGLLVQRSFEGITLPLGEEGEQCICL